MGNNENNDVDIEIGTTSFELSEGLRNEVLISKIPESSISLISQIAQKSLDMPIVSVTLLNDGRQWFKSTSGDIVGSNTTITLPDELATAKSLVVIEDATEDSRLRYSDITRTPPFVQFYAGTPINSNGRQIGTFSVMDRRKRNFTANNIEQLSLLAKQIELLVSSTGVDPTQAYQDLNLTSADAAKAQNTLSKTSLGMVHINSKGIIIDVNKIFAENLDYKPEEMIGHNITIIIPGKFAPMHDEYIRSYVDGERPSAIIGKGMKLTAQCKDGTLKEISIIITQMRGDHGLPEFIGLVM